MLADVRRLLVLVCVVIFVDAMLFGVLTPLIPGYAEAFDLSKTSAGVLVSAFGAGALIGGVPGGLAAIRIGPKRTVLLGLALLAAASLAFALAGDPWALGLSRFVQGASSTTTWAGALAWLTVVAPRARRGEILGVAFGCAVLGAILGPMFGATAQVVGIRVSFASVAGVALLLAAAAAWTPAAPVEHQRPGALRRAFHDRTFVGGLWLNTLPALLFGTIALLVPLALAGGGFTPFAIGAVFLTAGLIEAVLNPLVGRLSDRVGRLRPARAALAGSVVVSVGFAFVSQPAAIFALVCLASLAFGAFYTPGMALVSDRADVAGLAQGLAFGVMNSAWALGNLTGPALGGALADQWGDAAPYLLSAVLCGLTLVAVQVVARSRSRRAMPVVHSPS
jgi:predicted MFS family arabinose efflux permease